MFLQGLTDVKRVPLKQDVVQFPGKLKVHIRLILEAQKV